MDLEPLVYETFEQLQTYCDRVASSVGLACLRIWGCRERAGRAACPAVRRGVSDDEHPARSEGRRGAESQFICRGKISSGSTTTIADLRAGVRDERFRRLMRFQIERTERLYEEAAELERWLEPDGQRVFGSMVAVYRALLEEIKRLDGDVLSDARAIEPLAEDANRHAVGCFVRRRKAMRESAHHEFGRRPAARS